MIAGVSRAPWTHPYFYNRNLQYTTAVRYILDDRAPTDNRCVRNGKPCPFLQQELLYLVLLILDREITNSVSGGFMAQDTRASVVKISGLSLPRQSVE
jgi:hypothetical protein